MLKLLITAGLGGTLPTLCRLAAAYGVRPDQPAPTLGIYIAIALYFVVGAVVAFGFQESKLQKAFALGIAGPGIVASILNGATQSSAPQSPGPNTTSTGAPPLSRVLQDIGISMAYADPPNPSSAPHVGRAELAPAAGTQLTVSPTLSGAVGLATASPVTLRFFGKDGKALGQSAVSTSLQSTVNVPAGSTTLEASIASAKTTIALPQGDFHRGKLNLKISAQPSNDFLWALGAVRTSEVKNISADIR